MNILSFLYHIFSKTFVFAVGFLKQHMTAYGGVDLLVNFPGSMTLNIVASECYNRGEIEI